MKWIKSKLQKWLGIQQNAIDIHRLDKLYSDLTTMGVDVHFRSPHMIIIFSKLKGGQIRHIDAKFENLKELNELTQELKNRYRPRDIFFDVPHGIKNWF